MTPLGYVVIVVALVLDLALLAWAGRRDRGR